MSQNPFTGGWQHEYSLTDLIARSGRAGLRWAEEYRSPACKGIRRNFWESLELMRRHELAEGYRLLEEADGRLEALGKHISVPVERILTRERCSILAYHHYLLEDGDRSEELLAAAQESVRAAIEIEPCLIPQAIFGLEYCLQRARIARNRRRWDEMKLILEAARGMADDRIPLCVLSNGSAIFYSTVDTYLLSLRGLGEDEAAYVKTVTDRIRRRRKLDLFVENLYLIPDVIIPYRPPAAD